MNRIAPIRPETIFPVGQAVAPGQQAAPGFVQALKDAVGQVNDLQLTADKMATDLALGEARNLHEVMIAAEKASLALQLTVEIRNKMIDAYQDILRMPV